MGSAWLHSPPDRLDVVPNTRSLCGGGSLQAANGIRARTLGAAASITSDNSSSVCAGAAQTTIGRVRMLPGTSGAGIAGSGTRDQPRTEFKVLLYVCMRIGEACPRRPRQALRASPVLAMPRAAHRD